MKSSHYKWRLLTKSALESMRDAWRNPAVTLSDMTRTEWMTHHGYKILLTDQKTIRRAATENGWGPKASVQNLTATNPTAKAIMQRRYELRMCGLGPEATRSQLQTEARLRLCYPLEADFDAALLRYLLAAVRIGREGRRAA
jgi:hypothetical protein